MEGADKVERKQLQVDTAEVERDAESASDQASAPA